VKIEENGALYFATCACLIFLSVFEHTDIFQRFAPDPLLPQALRIAIMNNRFFLPEGTISEDLPSGFLFRISSWLVRILTRYQNADMEPRFLVILIKLHHYCSLSIYEAIEEEEERKQREAQDVDA